MQDPVEAQLKAEIDKITENINNIIKKIEIHNSSKEEETDDTPS